MAQVAGFRCDVCKTTFDTSDDNDVPEGWHVWRIRVKGTDPRLNTKHVCSNKCLKKLAIARERGEHDVAATANGSGIVHVTSDGRRISAEGAAARRQNGLRQAHQNGYHKGEKANDDCLLCLEELTST